MDWEVIHSGSLPPDVIMKKDTFLLGTLDSHSKPIFHFYEWQTSSLTYGWFTNPRDFLKMDEIHRLNWKAARRPTGGGIIFHLTDFAFSVLIPSSHPRFSLNTLENYKLINGLIAKTISPLILNNIPTFYQSQQNDNKDITCSFCMAKPTQYDLVIADKKAVGAAQRRTKKGFLHQGSLSLKFPPFVFLEKVLVNGSDVVAEMKKNSFALFESSSHSLEEARLIVKNLILEHVISQSI